MKTIEQLYGSHAGNVSDKWSSYLHFYEKIFSPLRDNPIKLLEVGIQNGGSLEIWGEYFKNAQALIGCDINPNCLKIAHSDPRIKVIIGDINNANTQQEIFKENPTFDIIIDDGSHTSGDIIQTFCKTFSSLNYGGIYVIEDLHASYWKQWQGGLKLQTSSMAFLKKLTDIINFEHWGLPISKKEYLKEFSLPTEVADSLFGEIHSIEFANSLCVITKKPHINNTLGKRRVAGSLASVVPIKQQDGMILITSPHQETAAHIESPINHEVVELMNQKLANKDKLIAMMAEQIVDLQQLLEFKA